MGRAPWDEGDTLDECSIVFLVMSVSCLSVYMFLLLFMSVCLSVYMSACSRYRDVQMDRQAGRQPASQPASQPGQRDQGKPRCQGRPKRPKSQTNQRGQHQNLKKHMVKTKKRIKPIKPNLLSWGGGGGFCEGLWCQRGGRKKNKEEEWREEG